MALDISIRIGGQAGQGMQSISSIMGKIFTRHGYYVFIHQDVESRIRGGHNYTQVRISDHPVQTFRDQVDLLIALDKGAVTADLPDLAKDGVMVFDGEKTGIASEQANHFSIPLEKIATEVGNNKIMVNSVATGAAFALLDFALQPLLDRLGEEFERKGAEVVRSNQDSASAGHRNVKEDYRGTHPFKIPQAALSRKKLLVNGSEAMALGAVCAGLKLYSGYPMSPSTPIMEYVASIAEEFAIVMEPAEDEIAAINMVVGASFAGVRSMTATSGGGFCLMVETMGLAGMTETPLVVVVAQRGGPSTGLPTRTEQSDLWFCLHAAHGEFPRAVLAPGDAEQAFYAMGKAFNLAEKYQIPVIVLGDQHLNDSTFTLDGLDLGKIAVDRGKAAADVDEYRRYAWDESGISPRIFPGQSRAVLYADSDEHTEQGHITENAEIRERMMRKRMRKLEGLRLEMEGPEIYPPQRADIALVGWGSTRGTLREAVDLLRSEGTSAQMIHFSDIFPFPRNAVTKKISGQSTIIAVENNYSGQFADYLRFETGIAVHRKILKYDGRPFSAEEIVAGVKNQ
jgi:2-oxoglutarate/2-oxoacid ferredoxin oxidoreductase subunit alpha